MLEKKRANFWLGFFLALLIGVVVWYWQKSTSADEGALDLLDELAKAKSTPAKPEVNKPDDLTAINGIGPVYARRLQEAGISTFAALAAQSADKIGQIVQLKEWQAGNPATWIAQARELSA